jgi:hypothetical protein
MNALNPEKEDIDKKFLTIGSKMTQLSKDKKIENKIDTSEIKKLVQYKGDSLSEKFKLLLNSITYFKEQLQKLGVKEVNQIPGIDEIGNDPAPKQNRVQEAGPSGRNFKPNGTPKQVDSKCCTIL